MTTTSPTLRWFFVALLIIASPGSPLIDTVHATPPAPQEPGEQGENAPEDEELEEFTVVGEATELKRIAGSAHLIDAEEMALFEYDDIHRVLAQIPGVYVREEDGFGLRPNIGLRGASSDRSSKLTLTEDGVLLGPAPYSAPAAYYFPVMTRMVGTEIFKGPASIQFGPSTIGGALNLVTAPVPKGSEIRLDLAGGEYLSGKAHAQLGYGSERFGFLLEGVHLRTNGFKVLDTAGPTGFEKNEAMLKGYVRSAPNARVVHQLDLKLGYSDELSHETYLGLSESDFNRSPYRRYAASERGLMDWERTSGTLSYFLGLTDSLDLTTTLYRHDFHRSWMKVNRFQSAYGQDLKSLLETDLSAGIPQALYRILTGEANSSELDGGSLELGNNDRTYVSEGLQSVLHWAPPEGVVSQEIEVGFRLHFDQITRNRTLSAWDMTEGGLLRTDAPEEASRNQGRATALALYLKDEISFGDLFISPGLRTELIVTEFASGDEKPKQLPSQQVLIPGLGLFYKITEEFGVLAGAYRGFSPTPPNASQAAEGAPAPTPEKSINYEVGSRYETTDTALELVGFANDYSNITAACRLSAAGQCAEQYGEQFNGGRALVYGAELGASHTARFTGGFFASAHLAYTWTDARFLDSFKSNFDQYREVQAGDQLPYVPVHQGNLKLGAGGSITGTQHWRVDLGLSYAGAMRDVAGAGDIPKTELIPAHTLLDGVATLSFGENSSLYLKADNLLNQAFIASRRPYGLRPGKPRLVMLGYKHAFKDLF